MIVSILLFLEYFVYLLADVTNLDEHRQRTHSAPPPRNNQGAYWFIRLSHFPKAKVLLKTFLYFTLVT